MQIKRAAALTAVAGSLLLAGCAGCGDDDEDSGRRLRDSDVNDDHDETADASEVTVTAKEYSFDLSATPTADTKEVVFDNQARSST